MTPTAMTATQASEFRAAGTDLSASGGAAASRPDR